MLRTLLPPDENNRRVHYAGHSFMFYTASRPTLLIGLSANEAPAQTLDECGVIVLGRATRMRAPHTYRNYARPPGTVTPPRTPSHRPPAGYSLGSVTARCIVRRLEKPVTSYRYTRVFRGSTFLPAASSASSISIGTLSNKICATHCIRYTQARPS